MKSMLALFVAVLFYGCSGSSVHRKEYTINATSRPQLQNYGQLAKRYSMFRISDSLAVTAKEAVSISVNTWCELFDGTRVRWLSCVDVDTESGFEQFGLQVFQLYETEGQAPPIVKFSVTQEIKEREVVNWIQDVAQSPRVFNGGSAIVTATLGPYIYGKPITDILPQQLVLLCLIPRGIWSDSFSPLPH